jgi:hypothetical protein
MAPAGDRGRPTKSGEHSKQLFNQTGNMVGVKDETHYGESLMDALTSSLGAGEKPLSSDGDADGSRLITEKGQKRRPQIESDAERIKSAVARLTSSSIDGLEGLASELQPHDPKHVSQRYFARGGHLCPDCSGRRGLIGRPLFPTAPALAWF